VDGEYPAERDNEEEYALGGRLRCGFVGIGNGVMVRRYIMCNGLFGSGYRRFWHTHDDGWLACFSMSREMGNGVVDAFVSGDVPPVSTGDAKDERDGENDRWTMQTFSVYICLLAK
jgi:hypothetical protein